MTNFKRSLAIGSMVLAIGATSVTAFASSSYNTPAEVVAGLTGKTVESVITEKSETGKNYGTIANEAGKLEEFKQEMLKVKEDSLAKKVADGKITQEKSDQIMKEIEENKANCDGTGDAKIGHQMGASFGNMHKNGNGVGRGQGQGQGQGQGNCAGISL